MLVDADVLEGGTGFKWTRLRDDERAELQVYLEDTDVECDPVDCGASAVNTLPDWSLAAAKPPPSDIVAFLARSRKSGRGPAA